MADLSVRTIQRIENNEVASLETLAALASAFDVQIQDLYIEENTPNVLNELDQTIQPDQQQLWLLEVKKIEQQYRLYRQLVKTVFICLLILAIYLLTKLSLPWPVYPISVIVGIFLFKSFKIFWFDNLLEQKKLTKLKQRRNTL